MVVIRNENGRYLCIRQGRVEFGDRCNAIRYDFEKDGVAEQLVIVKVMMGMQWEVEEA